MTTPPPVAVALDGLDEASALALARRLEGLVWGFKVNDLLLRADVQLVARLRHYGKVFCDAKLHDIPHTVANQVRVLAAAGADIITLHCSGGAAMLQAAVAAAHTTTPTGATTPLLAGVTLLTSLDEHQAQQLYGASSKDVVLRLADLAMHCGLNGLVCAANALPQVHQVDPQHTLQRIVPGIRLPEQPADDQHRTSAPTTAWQAGADLLVLGRPITQAPDPETVCRSLTQMWQQHIHK